MVLERGAITFVRKFNRSESTLFCELSFCRSALGEREVIPSNHGLGIMPPPLLQVNFRLVKLVVSVSHIP